MAIDIGRDAFEQGVYEAWQIGTALAGAVGRVGEINVSVVETKLIQMTGRFVERNASDMLEVLRAAEPLWRTPEPDMLETRMIVFGLREWGVDDMDAMRERLSETARRTDYAVWVDPAAEYRKVLALRVYSDAEIPVMRLNNDAAHSRVFRHE